MAMAAAGCGFDQPDSLEGWVAIKEDPFTCNIIPPRLLFLVSWNDVERKVAVTSRLRNRVVSDTEERHGRTGLFSFQELRGIHDLLCLIHPSLSGYLPELPEESWGVWAYVSYPETPENIDDICEHLQSTYFPIALETCKEQLLMSTMFEEHCHEEYFESLSELRRQGYDQAIVLAEETLKNVLFERELASSMAEIGDIYKREDEAVFKLNIAMAEMFNYLLQPFLDLREVACLKVREAKMEIQNPDNGERIRREFCARLTEWQGQYEEALDTIQDHYMKYYSKTKKILHEILVRLEEDRNRFGSTSFQFIAQERLYRVKEDYSLENLQFLHSKKKKYVQERDTVKEMIASVEEKADVRNELRQLESHVFDWQIKIYDLHLDILREEERLAKTQKEAITRTITDIEEQIVFYDAVEDVDELSSEEDMPSLMVTDPRLKLINNKLKAINTKRAKLRNKRTNLQAKVQSKETAKVEQVERFKQHHHIQRKIDQRKEEMEGKQDFVDEQRKITIERLKTFSVKYPTPATIKPPRYQPPSMRRGTNVQTTKGLSTINALSKNTTALSKNTAANSKTGAATRNKAGAVLAKDNKRKIVRPKRPSKDNVDGSGSQDIPVTIFVSGDPPPSSPQDTKSPSPVRDVNQTSVPGDTDNVLDTNSASSTPNPPAGVVPIPIAPPPFVVTTPTSIVNTATPTGAISTPDIVRPPTVNQPPAPSIGPPPPPPPPPPPAIVAPPPTLTFKKKDSSLTQEQKKSDSGEGKRPDLQAIQQGLKGLKPATERPEIQKQKGGSSGADPMAEMVNLIKRGVKLRPMKERKVDESPKHEQFATLTTPSEDHMKLLVESLNRINVFTRESSPESESDDGEFDD